MKRSVSPVPSNVKDSDVGIQGHTQLNNLINEICSIEEGECESCAV